MGDYLSDTDRQLLVRAMIKLVASTAVTDSEFRQALELLANISGTDTRLKVERSGKEEGNPSWKSGM